jgi:hypothetical protein
MLFLSWYLWVVPHILAGVCLIGLLRGRRARPPFMFFCYLVIQVAGFLCLLPLLTLHFPSAVSWYERINIADLAASELATLGVIYQLTDELILYRLSLRQAVRSVIRWMLAALLLVTPATSALLQNGTLRSTWKIFQIVDFSGNLATIGLLLALLLLTRALRISWRSLPAGIVLGFGIDGSAELSAATLFSVFGHGKNLVLLDVLRMAAFHVCVLIWLVYILLPEKQPGFTGHRPDRTDLESWDQEIQKLVR